MIVCLLIVSGCETNKTVTKSETYEEKSRWDHEKGIVKDWKSTFHITWK
jgi:hypothetical protein